MQTAEHNFNYSFLVDSVIKLALFLNVCLCLLFLLHSFLKDKLFAIKRYLWQTNFNAKIYRTILIFTSWELQHVGAINTKIVWDKKKMCYLYVCRYVHMYVFISIVYLIWASFIFSWQIVYVYKQKVIYALDFYF